MAFNGVCELFLRFPVTEAKREPCIACLEDWDKKCVNNKNRLPLFSIHTEQTNDAVVLLQTPGYGLLSEWNFARVSGEIWFSTHLD